MSAAEKFKQMDEEQLKDYMSCNPGAASKAFEFWYETHRGETRTVFKDRVEYKEREVVKEVKVKSPVNGGLVALASVSAVLGLIFMFDAVRLARVNDSLPSTVPMVQTPEQAGIPL